MTYKTQKSQYWRAFFVGHLNRCTVAHKLPNLPTQYRVYPYRFM